VSDRFAAAAAAFEAVHREDPAGQAVAYHAAMATWVDRLRPDASEALRLAARCQHLRRWALPRGDFPAGRAGYKKWRATLAMRHAEEAAAILRGVGYDHATAERVSKLLRKQGLRRDAEVQCLEDAACLVFLQQQLASFARVHPTDKVVDILQKTWTKMSDAGHAEALALLPALPPDVAAIVQRALAPD
jgi:hypothetical protein